MTRRAAVLAEAAMAEEGLGPPPCPYAVLVLGSGGRGESLLAADQDNAIVFADGEPDGPQDRWFAELGARMAELLDRAGVPYCKGGVMARNPQWRGSASTWRRRVGEWVTRSRPQDLLNVDIWFDLRAVHGELALGRAQFEYAYDLGAGHPSFAKLLGESLVVGNPFTLLGGFQLDGGRLDLKKFGLFPVVAAARTLAVRHGVRAGSTRERIDGLAALTIGGDADFAALKSSHALLIELLLDQQGRDLHDGLPASNRVETARLDRGRQAALKAALKAMQRAPDLVRDLMFG